MNLTLTLAWLTMIFWQGARIKPEHKEMVTVYFSDIVGFTRLSSTIDSSKVTDLLQRLYNQFDDLADRYEIHSLETIGDGKTWTTCICCISFMHCFYLSKVLWSQTYSFLNLIWHKDSLYYRAPEQHILPFQTISTIKNIAMQVLWPDLQLRP